MHFAIDTPQFGPYANPRTLAELAREAEAAGWDGFFIWDHINVNWVEPVADPWIALAAMASVTSRIRLGALVTPLARRHPWKVARETVTLDHLSNGRLVFGAGLGTDLFGELTIFGTATDDRIRAQMLDEGLQIITSLWSGEKVSFEGKHFSVKETQFLPKPVQSPRIPIWIAGTWPRKPPFRRAAKYDGVVAVGGDLEKALTPDSIREMIAFVKKHRASDDAFDVVQFGETRGLSNGEDTDIVAPFEAAGATWWVEGVLPWKRPFDEVRARIKKGPPRM